jgi:hypothetical protein
VVFYFSILALHIDRRRTSHGFFTLAQFAGRALRRTIVVGSANLSK